MSVLDDGGPAYPIPGLVYPNQVVDPGSFGMSLRDAFAIAALKDARLNPDTPELRDRLAQECYQMADAMLEARK